MLAHFTSTFFKINDVPNFSGLALRSAWNLYIASRTDETL